MKIIDFPGNTRTCNFSYHRVREGPNYFVCYYKNSSRLLYDPKDAWRTLESAKFTDSGKALKEWCLEMVETYGADEVTTRADTSFASEAQEESPTANTRTVI